jgi:putative redox protein
MIINIVYEGDLRTRCVHTGSGVQILTDAPKDNQGLGREFSPTDLVAAALGSCSLTLMGIVARKLQLDITGTQAEVIKEMQDTPLRRISQLTVKITCPHQFNETITQQLVDAVERCPVLHSLHPDIKIKIIHHWGNL